jgi:polar amino acid transport system substrate-binding protein
MMRRLFTAATLLLVTVLVHASAAWADRLDDVMARGKLIVGVSETTPPFSFRKPGTNTVTGYDIDLVNKVAQLIGVTVEPVPVSSAERIPMLQQGRLDLVATSMTRTAEREKLVDFSLIYFVSPHSVVVKKSSGINSVRELNGKKVSSARTSTAGENLKEVAPAAEIVYVDNYAVAFTALKDGAVDAFTTDDSVLKAIVQRDSPADFLFLQDFKKARNVGFALKKDEWRFKDAINKALMNLEVSGEAQKIFDSWFGPASEMPLARNFRISPD